MNFLVVANNSYFDACLFLRILECSFLFDINLANIFHVNFDMTTNVDFLFTFFYRV